MATGDASRLIAHARALGYDAVELAVRDPAIVDAPAVQDALGGLPVSAIGTGQAYLADGLSLSDNDPHIRDAALARLQEHCVLARKLDCPLVIIGLVRGRQGDYGQLIQSLRHLCRTADGFGVRLVIEPINRYETEIVNTAQQGLRLIEDVGAETLGLLLDTFHMNIEEANLSACFVSCRERLWHVHIADSNRLAPGLGHLDSRQIMGLLEALCYEGYVSVEIMPQPDAFTAMELALDTIRRCNRSVFGLP